MASLKEIKGRIASIKNTQKITSAMRMVSSAKLHHTQGMTEKFLYYKDQLQAIVERLGGFQLTSPQQENVHSVVLIPISSNSGLCGAFNSNINKATFQRIQELKSQGKEVLLLPIGKKIAHELQKAGIDCNLGYFNLILHIEKGGNFAEIAFLVEYLLQLHQNGTIDSVEFLYHHFKSMGSQVIQIDSLQLTVDKSVQHADEQSDSQPSTHNPQPSTYLTEPSPDELLASLFPRLLNAQAYGILLDSLTSEHAARMLAMQTADDNANDLLKELTLLYNKTRQQAITNELIDIMGGQSGKH
ncbi:MAG: ATP synthase F1 subunit gamma [Bacteroidaceae bacterium]|nr:ATP synthase F1 subunit gamma [Bacteroidaceae bacterium]